MRALRALGRFFWRFMIIFSFIVNIVLVIVLLAAGLLIFEIKNEIAQPLVTGLHSSFVGLDEATIDWTIPVRDTVPVNLDIPLEQDTVVILTDDVPLVVTANITAPGLTVSNAQVSLTLPVGLELPVALDLDVQVRDSLPVSLDVRAVIPLEQTQLHDVANNLRLLFEPFGRGLHNLPSEWGEVPDFVSEVVSGDVNLLDENAYSENPWPGFSRTAGLNYQLADEAVPLANIPLQTGVVMQGGIPGLDEQLRPQVYDQGGPAEVNTQAVDGMSAFGIAPAFFGAEGINTEMNVQDSTNEQTNSPEDTTTLPQSENDSTVTSDENVEQTPDPNSGTVGAGENAPDATQETEFEPTPTGG